MVVISAPLVGFSFIQAARLYSQNSASALNLPQLAVNQNPLDGTVIPIFSGVYLMNTFLFPFVAIRAIGNEKQTGALKLALQLPVGMYRAVGVKLAALFVCWSIALVPTLSALMIWSMLLGGHLYLPEVGSVLPRVVRVGHRRSHVSGRGADRIIRHGSDRGAGVHAGVVEPRIAGNTGT
jgi:hypothetical protein